MYATRYAPADTGRPLRMGAALAINGGILAALLFAAPNIVPLEREGGIPTIPNIPIQPDPPEVKPETKAETEPQNPLIVIPVTPVRPTDQPVLESTTSEPPFAPDPFPPAPGDGLGGTGKVMDPPAPPPLIGASLDPRYADALQPSYPSPDIRANREGSVVVRVRIGTDGRVKAVERVSAPSDTMFTATQQQAMRKWRFKPATRGGTPEESWKTMTVRFELENR